ncbi:MAG: PQQ-like beta-propeller repeat protein [Candidatus Hydrogenedentes bacterium]|nr:PQQ-like beta-propeller repeat protein [Candidatus Hydrogenedentota bacterium]
MSTRFARWSLVLSIALVTTHAFNAMAQADWPSFRGPDHDGKSPDTGLLKEWPAEGPKLLWRAPDIGKGYSSVSIGGGAIFITGDVGDKLVIFALDMDGKLKWKKDAAPAGALDRPGSRGNVTLDGDTGFLLSGTGILSSFDAKSGDVKWSKKMEEFGGAPSNWGYAESPLIAGDRLVVKPGGAKCIVALEKATGKPIWASQGFSAAPEYGSCLPFTFDNVPMIVTGTNAGLVCVKAQTGELVWSNPFSAKNTANCPTPAFSDGYVFWANGYGRGGICLKLEPGGKATEAWKTSEMVCHHGGYIIDKGYIYGDNGKGISCLDLKTGELKWKDPAVGKGSLCWADGMLYLFSEKNGQGALAAYSPAGMQIKGQVKVDGTGPSWAHPVVIGGRLYLRYDTTLYCFDIRAK